MKTKRDEGTPTHTPSDTTMENLAALDMLAREWGENSPVVNRFELAVNCHGELVESLKCLANVANGKGLDDSVVDSLIHQARQAIAKAEGK